MQDGLAEDVDFVGGFEPGEEEIRKDVKKDCGADYLPSAELGDVLESLVLAVELFFNLGRFGAW